MRKMTGRERASLITGGIKESEAPGIGNGITGGYL